MNQKNKAIRDIRRENYDGDKILRDIRTLFETLVEEDYYKPIWTGNAFSSNYIEYKSNGDKDNMLPIEDYLDKIEPYLKDLIDGHKTHDEEKVQLTMKINFISSKNSDETRTMHIKNKMITEIIIDKKTDEIIEELFNSLLQMTPKNLEEPMKRNEFIFDNADLVFFISFIK